jgi:hypothetical protein
VAQAIITTTWIKRLDKQPHEEIPLWMRNPA